jgi:flagellar biosynthesis/type III secretory pathway chaperone
MEGLQARFAEILQKELDQLIQLEAVLGQEHESLKQRDTDALSKISQEKQNLIKSIEALGRDRLAQLQGGGTAIDKESLLSFVDAESSGELRRLWNELEAVLLRCQKQNQVNGIMLEMGKQHTEQLLGILLGEGDRKETETYDAKGGTSSSFLNGRSIKV